MTKLRDQVREFSAAFNVPCRATPGVPDDDTVRLRLRLIAEEFVELLDATIDTESVVCGSSYSAQRDMIRCALQFVIDEYPVKMDLVESVDALGDLQYVISGSYLAYGVDDEQITDEIHASNMTKLGADGRPIVLPGGKIGKSESYRRPDLEMALRQQGWQP